MERRPAHEGGRWREASSKLREDATFRVGLIGGRGSGKSALFKALVYRTLNRRRAGVLSSFLDDNIDLFQALDDDVMGGRPDLSDFLEDYVGWEDRGSTLKDKMEWFKLRLEVRLGWLGQRRETLDVQFLDAAGERLSMPPRLEEDKYMWKRAYVGAQVMVFCVPIWAVFPRDLNDKLVERRYQVLQDWQAINRNLKEAIALEEKRPPPFRSIIALTMADDHAHYDLDPLYERWIEPFLVDEVGSMKALRTSGGVMRYLESARRVSNALHEAFDNLRDNRMSAMPSEAQFGGSSPPWIIPVSALEGAYMGAGAARRPFEGPPRPAHVELPLLVALAERYNALM